MSDVSTDTTTEPASPANAEDAPIVFPAGLPGFGDAHEFDLAPVPDSPLSRLMCRTDPAAAFLVALPGLFFDDYAPKLPVADMAAIGDPDDEDLVVLVILNISGDAPTANLMGPVLLNAGSRLAIQSVLDQGYDARTPLA